MHSLLIRIFLSFWLIIGVTIGAGVAAGYYYAERAREAFDNFEFSDATLEASRALETGGRAGLADWLTRKSETSGLTLYVLDARDEDILGREVPRRLARFVHRHRRHLHGRSSPGSDSTNVRRARPLSQLVAPDGALYTILFAPPAGKGGLAAVPAGSLLLLLALLVSGAVSYLLARAISAPVRRLRDATVAVACGDLTSRVASAVGGRKDELGMLARDFDSMAEALQTAAAQQTELTRNISHELRSPLARLRVATELAKRRAGNLNELERIDDEAERLDRLIGQILSYARLESPPSPDGRPVDLAELVQEVAGNVNFECRDEGLNGVHVVTEVLASPIVHGHAEALTSAVENVLRNAIHHSPAGKPVRLRLTGDGRTATIEVSDQGPGVAEDELPRLFEPFFRTRRAAGDGGRGGTGLGLAIARRALRRHRGTIAAHNQAGSGLRVTIELPLAGSRPGERVR